MPAAQVLIDGPSELVFDYAIPEGLTVVAGHRVRVPLRNRPASGTVLRVHQPADLGFALRPLDSLIDLEPLITPNLLKLADWMADYYGTPLEHIMRSLLPEAVRQEKHSQKTIKQALARPEIDAEELAKLARRAPRQHSILALLQAAGEEGLPLSQLGEGAAGPVKALADKGLVTLREIAVQRDPDAEETFLPDPEKTLNSEQAAAYESIVDNIRNEKTRKPLLLHGITGSGKTEVYLQATRAALAEGKSVIVLLPEISLTPQTVQRFKSRFSDEPGLVAVLHSTLTQGERFDEWHRIRKGEARVVIGARSALFAPLPDLGLILVDEEHETTYKQENPPKYHGRDLAVVRAHLEEATIVLGSATPSVESYHNSRNKEKYHLVPLTRRADGQSLPLIRIVDMRNEPKKGGPPILSQRLRHAMEQKLTAGDQIILFLNRRGFARSLTCPTCGHTCECAHCSIPTTYHRAEERLICHLCGYQSIVPRTCPKCQDPAIRLQGYGTEKVEEVLRKVFPQARLARLDGDTVRKKHVLKRTLGDFKARKIDILLGTQMIAKGLDFPNVTLVGVLNADLSLNAPDFRAGERTFSLLTQVAGRAGRGEMEGEVFIQTFVPHSPSIQYARHHDFEGFVEQELEFREKYHFPPFTHLALLSTRSRHEKRAEFTLETIHRRLSEEPPAGLEIGLPNPNPITRAHDLHRFQLLLRHRNPRVLTRHIHRTLAKLPIPEDVTLVVDIDAHDFS
ncbi:replication restart helicase PriA [Roseibacillus ishigakijimensis]|uniref:Replication restart protein PriA n=1 Tax=Roseibacillus ishigakijimensis TaxID=454146 RepID=A0A934RT80_9BACT|nr:primosomal protein N' [Roseibacillus ishigakijimensis]MBK1835512.1 primosomal protein N' [Roseibacillus ishigakijimensis]